MKIKNKKAQYYLLAAAVIVAVLIGVSFVTNYAITRKKPMRFYDLSDELKEECARIIDYGINEEVDVTGLIGNFIQGQLIKYAQEKEINIEFVIVYGDRLNLKIADYENKILEIRRLDYDSVFEDDEADWTCIDETFEGNIKGSSYDNKNILLRNCHLKGNIEEITGAKLKIESSTIDGGIKIEDIDIEIIDSGVQNIEIKNGITISINNTVEGNIIVEGDSTLFATDNTVSGNLKADCSTTIIQAGNNIAGNMEICKDKIKEFVEVEIFNNTYTVDTQEGTNCFFVLAKEIDGEIYIAESEWL